LRHTVVKTSPYSAEQLFQLVGDVDRYPEFVPWITSMRTWNKRQVGPDVSMVDAEAGVGFSFLKERFSTRVRRDAAIHEITVGLIRGPFHHLMNRWRFKPLEAGATIEFEIDFAFKSRMLDNLLRNNFERAAERLIQCFEDRAAVLYGRRAG
jgi:coenzyme Q-binding protein COQ10